jgi:hypothetical protein
VSDTIRAGALTVPRLAMFVLLTAVAACASTGDVTAAGSRLARTMVRADTTVIRFTLPPRAGVMTSAQIEAVANRVATIRTEPSAITLRVGDSVYVQTLLRAFLVDSSGTDIGEIYRYDFAPSGPELWMVRDGRLWGRQMGTAQYRIQFPRQYWKGDLALRPNVTVPILVTPTGRTSPAVVVPPVAPPR